MDNKSSPQLVAHRGYSRAYPENTLLAIEQALIAGACYIEFDVQLTQDGIPVVVHDAELLRTTGVDADITTMTSAQAVVTSAAYQEKFQNRFLSAKIPRLVDVMELLTAWPGRKCFLEIKRDSLRAFGVNVVVDKLLSVIQPYLSNVILISFDEDVLRVLKNRGIKQIGWVFEQWETGTMDIAQSLQPEYVFADYECFPESLEQLPASDWQWAVYEIDQAELATQWIEKGAQLVETNAIGEMLEHPFFLESRCNE